MAEALRLFRQVYEHRMGQLHASPLLLFPGRVLHGTGAKRTNLGVALAWLGEELVGGTAIPWLIDRFAHYHLGGANGKRPENSTLPHCSLTRRALNGAREHGCRLLQPWGRWRRRLRIQEELRWTNFSGITL